MGGKVGYMQNKLNFSGGNILRTIISVAIGIYIVRKYNAGVVEMAFVMVGSYIFLGIIGMI